MPATPAAEIRGTTLRPPEVERAYRESYLRDDARMAAVFIAMVTVAYALFAVSDPRFAATPRALAAVLLVRVTFTAIGVVAVWAILRTRRPAVLDWWVVAWSLAFAVRGIVFQSTRPSDHFMPILGDVAVSLCLWAMLSIRFPAQAAAVGLVSAGAVTWLLAFRGPAPYDSWGMIVSAWVLGNGVGANAAWRSHRQRRATYLDMLRLAEAEEAALAREAALRESESRFRALTNASPVGVYQADPQGNAVFLNPAMERMMGMSAAQAMGKGWMESVHPEDRERVFREWLAAIEAGRDFSSEYRFLAPSGKVTWARGYGSAIRDPSGVSTGYVAVVVDLTDRLAMEQRLAVASRLAAMGTLVAGVAHEINNPMTAIMAGLGTAMGDVRQGLEELRGGGAPSQEALIERDEELVEVLEEASEAAARIARIVRDLAVFGAPKQDRARLRSADVVAGAMRWLPSHVHRVSTVSVEDLGAPDVMASRGQVEQVLVNLVTNAARATRPGTKGAIRVRVGPGSPGMASLEVIDQGMGIDAANLGRIFDPFFTTRPAGEGRGMGLGLAICHAIVAEHGGTITVKSELGKGSTFRVELPAAPAGPAYLAL
jgi:PAS domain S-box-containing protein